MGLGYTSISVLSSTKVTIFDIALPLYGSYNFNESCSLYGGPKFVYRHAQTEYTADSSSESGSSPIVGGTGGLALGHDFQVFLEYSYFSGPAEVDRAGIQQVMVGFNFGADNIDRFSRPKEQEDSVPEVKHAPRKKK